MFNFQFALLGEAVETDFQAVRTVRFKKSLRDGEHSHYKARIQLWREQDDDTEVLASTPSVAPTATREAWAQPSLKIHTTRIVMYWDETITTFFGNFQFTQFSRPPSLTNVQSPIQLKSKSANAVARSASSPVHTKPSRTQHL
jgi:hypothetical protein